MDLLALSAALTVVVTVLVVSFAFYASAATGAQVRGRLDGVLAGSLSSGVESSAVGALRQAPSVASMFRFFFSGGWLDRIAADLRKADSNLQPVDYITIRIFLSGIGFAAAMLFIPGIMMGLGVGIGAAVVGFLAPRFWIKNREAGRKKKLEVQLPEALMLISGALKAGFGLLQALNQAGQQMEDPLATELRVTIHEMNVGSSVEEAMLGLSDRTGSYDLDLVVTAILIQRSVGGNLSEVLETVANTMRERVRIRGEITTLTAQQKLTGIVIGLLPVGVGAMFTVVSPDYINVLFTDPLGRMMLAAAIVLEATGIFIIQRILDIEV
ncbi:MAG: type II secretion system F family protein [Dehalococcoidia bacterium]